MKWLALAIGVVGAAQATLWAWAPPLLRWQARNGLERYNAIESLDLVLLEQEAALRFTFIEAGLVGSLMLLASVLVLRRRRMGWNLWVACLCLALAGSVFAIASAGPSLGGIVRVALLLTFAGATFEFHRTGRLSKWYCLSSSSEA